MQNKEFINEYDDLQNGKKSIALITKVYAISGVVIVIAVLVFSFSMFLSTVDKIKVVNTNGKVIDSQLIDETKLMKSIITSHCEESSYYLNTFNRSTLETNQAKAKFLVNTRDANKVFETYLSQASYSDVLQRGYSYKSEFVNIETFDINETPIKVKFLSKLTIHKNENKQIYYIISEGLLESTTAQFPENKHGFFFVKYKQAYKNKD